MTATTSLLEAGGERLNLRNCEYISGLWFRTLAWKKLT